MPPKNLPLCHLPIRHNTIKATALKKTLVGTEFLDFFLHNSGSYYGLKASQCIKDTSKRLGDESTVAFALVKHQQKTNNSDFAECLPHKKNVTGGSHSLQTKEPQTAESVMERAKT